MDFYPSAKVKLKFRFDEFNQKTLAANAPTQQAKNLKGKGASRSFATAQSSGKPLSVVQEEGADGALRWVLKGENTQVGTKVGGDDKGTPTQPQSDLQSNTESVLGVIPHQAVLNINGPRVPDTLSLTLRWEDFPIDPRTVRALGVEFYLGTVTAADFAAGQNGATRAVAGGGADGAQEPRSIVPDTYLANGKEYSNKRFVGWVDKYKMTFNDGVPFVNLECVDNSRLIINQKKPTNLPIDVTKPISEAIAKFLANFPQLEGMTVKYIPADKEISYGSVMKKDTHPPNMGPPSGGAGETMTIFDYLVQVTGAMGHILYIDGTDIIIRYPNTLVGKSRIPRTDDPYTKRGADGVSYPNRALIYGINVSEVTYSREYAGKEPRNFEVRCYDPTRKNIIVARYPEKGDRVVSALPGGKDDQKWEEVVLEGAYNAVQLKEIARQTYEASCRNEIGITVKTHDGFSYAGNNDNPDLFALKTGDAIDIYPNKLVPASTVGRVSNDLAAAQTASAYLRRLGFTDSFAELYAKSISNVGLQHTFYTRNAKMTFDVEAGVEIEIEACNFIEARLDQPNAVPSEGPFAKSDQATQDSVSGNSGTSSGS